MMIDLTFTLCKCFLNLLFIGQGKKCTFHSCIFDKVYVNQYCVKTFKTFTMYYIPEVQIEVI